MEQNKDTQKKSLLIVESPAKAKTIQKYLAGTNITVMASVGHIKELPRNSLGVDVEKGFKTEFVPIADKADVIKKIKKAAKEADYIYLGSDPDREGEAISFHVKELIKGKKNVFRVLFNEITKDAIKKALANPAQLDEKKYEAQKTRRILDRLVGYKISPLLWRKIGEGLSAGRVQSVALRLIVEKEEEILAFNPEKFFTIVAKLLKNNIEFETRYFGDNPDKKSELKDELLAKSIYSEVCESKDFVVHSVVAKEKIQKTSPPFTTSRLQQESSNKLKFPSQKTMQIAQKLYEGVALGVSGNQGLITYMRTDSVRTEPVALEALRQFIKEKYGDEYLSPEPVVHKKKKDLNTQDAHEAIRPTNLKNTPESIRKFLSEEEYKLYTLIWNKFVASQMNPAIIDQTIATFVVKDKHYFRSLGSVIRFAGFRIVYLDEEDKGKDEEGALPKLEMKEFLNPIEPPKLSEKWTIPPPRYTEATLIKELEERGIGRPSTYSAIISNITNRKYVIKNDNKFQPTESGTNLCHVLIAHFPKEMEIQFTAKMEDDLDAIEEGTIEWLTVLDRFWKTFSETLTKADTEIKTTKEDKPRPIDPKKATNIVCRKCGHGVYIRLKAKDGKREFLGCSRYPECKATENFKFVKNEVKIVEPEKKYRDAPCPTCGKKMIFKKFNQSAFWGCEGYPECKQTLPETATGVRCPDCNKGEYCKFTAKKDGSVFYGCSNYQNGCKSATKLPPQHLSCPKCQHPVTGIEKAKDGNWIVCPKCKQYSEDKEQVKA